MSTAQELLKTIRSRRTVGPRLYTDEIVSEEIIKDILEAANWAPNHGRTEPWRLKVFTGEGLKKYNELVEQAWDEAPEEYQRPGKLEKWTTNSLKASHIISLGMKRCETKVIPAVEEICAVSCAAQNMMLVATQHGVGSYWSSGVAHFPSAAKAFGLDGEEDCMLGFIHLGHFEGDFDEGCRKSPIEDKVEWVK